MIAINRCIYNGYSSKDFDLLCDLAFDGDSGETSTYLSREAIASENYKGDFKRVHNYKYDDVFTPQITFIKEDFGDFSLDEQRKVLRWLTSKSTPSFLTVYYDDSEVITYEILGGFTEIETYKLGNGRTVGIIATFESISPYVFSALKTITKDVSNPPDVPDESSDIKYNEIKIDINSDEPESFIYPRITIQQDHATSVVTIDHAILEENKKDMVTNTVYFDKYGGWYYWIDTNGYYNENRDNESGFDTTSVAIKNVHKGQEYASTVANNIKGEKIIIDGANKLVSSSRTNGRIFGDDFTWHWIPLGQGENAITVIGNCTVTIEYREPIKCGEF